MFEKLVESDGRPSRSRARATLLTASSLIVASFVAFTVVFSLFNHTLAMGAEPGDIARLLSPVSPDIEPENRPATDDKPESADRTKSPERTELVQRSQDVPVSVPDKVSNVPSTVFPMPIGDVKLSNRNWDPPSGVTNRGSSSEEGGFGQSNGDKSENSDKTTLKIEREVVPEPPKINRPPEHIGIVNSKAIHLDKPVYPAIAKQMGIKGSVKVQVLINTEGRVVSASAIEGPPVLRRVSVDAAKASRFSPTIVNTTPVSVRGIIIYNFK
ncbi:MAG: TonB family protein [Acidobacteriota bacterium]|nr:MAG: TonB family protein [Acidobacteriota bacterium]